MLSCVYWQYNHFKWTICYFRLSSEVTLVSGNLIPTCNHRGVQSNPYNLTIPAFTQVLLSYNMLLTAGAPTTPTSSSCIML